MHMNGIRNKKLFLIPVFVLIIVFFTSKSDFIKKSGGTIKGICVNITLQDKQESPFTYAVRENGIKKLKVQNSNFGLGFGDSASLKQYIEENNISEQEFTQKYGYVRAYFREGDKQLYVLSLLSKKTVWNLLIIEKYKSSIFKLADITENVDDNNFSFVSKIEKRLDDIYIYLESGIYILKEDYSICSISFDLNNILREISEQDLIPSITRIEYI